MVLFATCNLYPHPTPSLAALLESLKAKGVNAAHRPWKDMALDVFAKADAVLPLCCWDYHDDPESFRHWIDDLDAAGARLFNCADMLRWNLRKTYLLDMADKGLRVPETFHLQDASPRVIEARLAEQGWDSAVLKPVSGQSGHGVRKVDLGDKSSWPAGGEALLQEFQSDIGERGETTLTFIDGVFSHAVRRVLRSGEWRANQQYGITPERVDVDEKTIEAARSYLTVLPSTPLYARVDGLVRPDGFMLMELELIEPYLYCEFAPESAARFADALIARLG